MRRVLPWEVMPVKDGPFVVADVGVDVAPRDVREQGRVEGAHSRKEAAHLSFTTQFSEKQSVFNLIRLFMPTAGPLLVSFFLNPRLSPDILHL